MKLKLFLSMMMVSAITEPMHGLGGIQNINMDQLNEDIIGTAKQLQPILKDLAAGYFDALGDELDKHPLDLTPTIKFLINNMDNIKNGLLSTLPKIPYDQIPAQYQAEVRTVANDVAANIGKFDEIKKELPKILPYANVTAEKDSFIPILALASTAPGYESIKPELQKIYTDGIKPGLDMLANAITDSSQLEPKLLTLFPNYKELSPQEQRELRKKILNLALLEEAIEPLKKQLSGQPFNLITDLPKIAGGLVQFKKLVPAITGTLAGIIGLVLAINKARIELAAGGRPVKLPKVLEEALAKIEAKDKTLTNLINMLNAKVDEGIAALAKQLKGG